MEDTELWKKRVEDWRGSGLSAAEYCKDQEFTAGTLYRWSSRLAQPARSEAVRALPLVQWVGPQPSPAERMESSPQAATVIIEVHGTRVLVPPGTDVATVSVVLEALGAGGRSVAR